MNTDRPQVKQYKDFVASLPPERQDVQLRALFAYLGYLAQRQRQTREALTTRDDG